MFSEAPGRVSTKTIGLSKWADVGSHHAVEPPLAEMVHCKPGLGQEQEPRWSKGRRTLFTFIRLSNQMSYLIILKHFPQS